jgi:nitroreductase/NAD-dependent dihydropyrimidine dehydrogenase PreA subunit
MIDTEKCTACGACVAECPAYVLSLADNKASVVASERCIICGHCVAVCPEAAISHAALPGPCEAPDPGLAVNPNALMQLIRSRRSIRSYTDEPVSDGDLATLLNAARYAPTGHNLQPWHFTVIRSRAKLVALGNAVAHYFELILNQLSDPARRQVFASALPPGMLDALRETEPSLRLIVKSHREGVDMVFRGAPALIVIHTPRSALLGVEDSHYAAANIMLMAHAMGLGACPIGFLARPARHSREIAAAVGIPPENEIGAALVVGHPRHRYQRIVPRRDLRVAWM